MKKRKKKEKVGNDVRHWLAIVLMLSIPPAFIVGNKIVSQLQPQTEKVVIQKILEATVYIEAWTEENVKLWSGSGVVVDGRVLTAAHVMRGAQKFIIRNIHGEELEYLATYYDDENDFGYFDLRDKNVPSVNIVDSNSLQYGDTVYVCGAPLGDELFPCLTKGIVSGLDRHLIFFGIGPQIQVDAQSWPGNSGGGVFDKNGNVIGLLIGGYYGADGISIVVPSRLIMEKLYYGSKT